MKNKRLIHFVFCTLIGCTIGCMGLLGLQGCHTSQTSRSLSPLEQWMKPNGKLKVLSTTAMIDDLVSQVGGEDVDHLALITGELDPHNYELVKGDEEKFSFAQIIFSNGLGLEHGASVRQKLQGHSSHISVGDMVERQDPKLILSVKRQKDPHIWMDISLWMRAIDPIVHALSKARPELTETFNKNAALAREKMERVHNKLKEDMHAIPAEKRYLVTSHDAFSYFAHAYLAAADEEEQSAWGKRVAAPEGLAPEGQLSAADIQHIIDHLDAYHIQVVFPESNVNPDSLKKILHSCEKKGISLRISKQVLYADAMGSRESQADTYLKMIERDCAVLIEEWKR